MGKKWRVTVDREACIGAGACKAAAPSRFNLDSEYRSSAVEESIDQDPVVLSAARACPVDAITIMDVETGQSVYP